MLMPPRYSCTYANPIQYMLSGEFSLHTCAGVKFDVRKLNVGDFLWIARKKVEPLPGL